MLAFIAFAQFVGSVAEKPARAVSLAQDIYCANGGRDAGLRDGVSGEG
jgi:hypothetical protein